MCIATQYVYQCYGCHSTVIKDLHHGPRYPCPLAMTTGPGPGRGVPLLEYCPSGLVWTSQRRRCCDDIDPRAANTKDDDAYRYFLLRSEKFCLWCEVQNEVRRLGIHAESEVLDPPAAADPNSRARTSVPTTSPTPPSSTRPSAAASGKSSKKKISAKVKSRKKIACGCYTYKYWGEEDHRRYHLRQEEEEEARSKAKPVCGSESDSDDDDEGGAPL
ncbi:hypothetical protein PG997_007982 [Apiospora hydei]|uniref:Uncharacterized protein n=1 Tax=Apiospora hydei TaxID=1337664 RepID=A0ABR1WDB6_9PEZI